jgi:flagellar motor protein MotB
MAGNEGNIVIKKIKKGGHGGHHGGAWKVAYADFVTAMMAFFLLMWLINTTTPEQKRGIADYFAPGPSAVQTEMVHFWAARLQAKMVMMGRHLPSKSSAPTPTSHPENPRRPRRWQTSSQDAKQALEQAAASFGKLCKTARPAQFSPRLIDDTPEACDSIVVRWPLDVRGWQTEPTPHVQPAPRSCEVVMNCQTISHRHAWGSLPGRVAIQIGTCIGSRQFELKDAEDGRRSRIAEVSGKATSEPLPITPRLSKSAH